MGVETLARGRLLPDFSGTNTRGDSGVTHLAAEPGGKDCGTLTLWVGHRSEAEIKRVVPPGAFRPPPKVDSALVRLRARAKPLVEVADEEGDFRLIRAAFAMRRKTLRNNLRALAPSGGEAPDWEAVLGRAGVEGDRRAETLSAEGFARIFGEMRT